MMTFSGSLNSTVGFTACFGLESWFLLMTRHFGICQRSLCGHQLPSLLPISRSWFNGIRLTRGMRETGSLFSMCLLVQTLSLSLRDTSLLAMPGSHCTLYSGSKATDTLPLEVGSFAGFVISFRVVSQVTQWELVAPLLLQLREYLLIRSVLWVVGRRLLGSVMSKKTQRCFKRRYFTGVQCTTRLSPRRIFNLFHYVLLLYPWIMSVFVRPVNPPSRALTFSGQYFIASSTWESGRIFRILNLMPP
ncbi:hypothetical protein EDD22DRAFT_169077 [Suillus occidentalis]|nr:hypothetical protein EDD22DRAFT_169077 [Suillus occidentalis]